MLKCTKDILIKLIGVCFLIVLWILYRLAFITKSDYSGFIHKFYCIYDYIMMGWFNNLNYWMSYDLLRRDLLMILAANCLDILFITFMFEFILRGKSPRIIIALSMFYGTRGVFVQNVSLFGRMENYLWDQPGFFSLTVPLFPANDFFFSGHIGSIVICTLYLSEYGRDKLLSKIAGIFTALIQIVVMYGTRGHYTIDLIFGFIIAKICYYHSQAISIYVEAKCCNVFGGRKKTVQITNEKEEVNGDHDNSINWLDKNTKLLDNKALQNV